MTDKNRARIAFGLLCLGFLAMPEQAHAQQFLQGSLQFIQSQVMANVSTLAIILVGGLCAFARFDYRVIIGAMVGTWIMFHADELGGYLRS